MGNENEMTQVETVQTSVESMEDVLNGAQAELDAGVEAGTAEQIKPEAATPAGESEKKPEWDPERQRADQAEANLRKLERERESLRTEREAAVTKTTALEAKLEEILNANQVKLEDVDADLVDPKLLKVIEGLQTNIQKANAKVSELENVRKEYENNQVQAKKDAEFEQEKSRILADIEEDFPAKFRNDAIALANEKVKQAGVAPKNAYEAARLLRSCYKELAGKPARTVTKPITTDSGSGGSVVTATEGIKPGSLREVAAQLRSKK